jgi:hypothetical protein
MRSLANTVDYSQGLPSSLGFIAALQEAVPPEVIMLKPDEGERVKKWVEGPGPLKRSLGFMKSAFYQISEGRPEPAARLVISAAVLAGYGWREDPDLAARIIETARRIVQSALAAKTGAAAGLGEDMLVLSALDPRTVSADVLDRLQNYSIKAMAYLTRANTFINRGDTKEAEDAASRARYYGEKIIQDDPSQGMNIIGVANRIIHRVKGSRGETTRRIAGLSFPIHAFDSKGTMWGTGGSPTKLAVLLGMLEKVRR